MKLSCLLIVRHSLWFLHVVFGMISPEAAVSILQACLRAQAGMRFGLPGTSCLVGFLSLDHLMSWSEVEPHT